MQCNRLSFVVAIEDEPGGAGLRIKQALSAAGASILSAEQLGNQALVFSIETTAGQLQALLAELQRCSRVMAPGEADVKRLARELEPQIEVYGTLHVTLVHTAADQRVRRPRVPG